MSSYTLSQWILLFYIYCFLGWVVESTIVSVRQRRFVNRGFLNGPFLPIYGTGTILILLVAFPLKSYPLLVYIVGLVSTTILEYFTGLMMETVFKIKYWDYSEDKFNYKGRICLESSLFWGVLTLFVIYVINKPINYFVLSLDPYFVKIISIISSIFFIGDSLYSAYNVLNLNRLLAFITKIKVELESLSSQVKEKASSISTPELKTLKTSITNLLKEYDAYTTKIKFSHKQLIKAYPSAKSKKFYDTFKELKAKVEDKLNYK